MDGKIISIFLCDLCDLCGQFVFGGGLSRWAFCAFSRLIRSGELPDGGEFPNGEVYGADSLKCWVSRNWFGVVGSGDFAHYLAGTRVERLNSADTQTLL